MSWHKWTIQLSTWAEVTEVNRTQCHPFLACKMLLAGRADMPLDSSKTVSKSNLSVSEAADRSGPNAENQQMLNILPLGT